MPPTVDLTSHFRTERYGPHRRMHIDVFTPHRPMDEHAPEQNAPALSPTLLFFYGGGWKKGSRQLYRPLGLALAKAGYAVAIADYRLYPEVKFPAFMEDAAAALSWVEAFAPGFGGNPANIHIMGHSAGAHIGALLCLDEAWLEAENLTPAIIRSFVGLAGPYTANMMRAGSVAPIFDSADNMARTRPIKMIGKDRPMPPALLLHGSSDKTVAWQNSAIFAKAIEDLGGAVETGFYPGIGHIGLLTTLARGLRWRAPSWAAVLEFLGNQSGPPAQETTDTPSRQSAGHAPQS